MLDNILKNDNIKEYWKENGLSDKDFYCRECGKLMLDVENAEHVRYDPSQTKFICKFIDSESKKFKLFVESDANIWLVKGRFLSGKTYFRHLCWDCLFKHLGEVEDIPRRARKSSWYRDINNGILRPPRPCQSPSRYFKLIFDITDEELEQEHMKFDTASKESFVRRYGVAEAAVRYDEYRKRQAYTCSKEYMMNERGMTEAQWNQYNANRASTKENFIKRYGKELGSRKWKEYCEWEAYVGCKLDYFIEKYGQTKGREMYLSVNRKKAQTLENFIRIYGPEEGEKIFSEYSGKMYSNESEELFSAIDLKMDIWDGESMHGMKELPVTVSFPDGTCRVCFPDYVLGKKVIEFNGDYWHANPKIYSPETIMESITSTSSRYSGNKASDIWEYDRKKISALESLGYDVKVVWESDFKKDPGKTINDCVKFLKGE